MATFIAISYVSDDGTRSEFTCAPGSREHREALEHERAGVCVVIEPVELEPAEAFVTMLDARYP